MTNEEYLSTVKDHVDEVSTLAKNLCKLVIYRCNSHDSTKFSPIEYKLMAKHREKMDKCKFGTDEYNEILKLIEPAKLHHYKCNRHHPQHFDNDLSKMNLIDIIEMICDWISAARRQHKDGNIKESINICINEFNIQDPLKGIIENTIELLNDDKNFSIESKSISDKRVG